MPVVTLGWVNPHKANALLCERCGFLADAAAMSDPVALKVARAHVDETGHTVYRHRTRVQAFRMVGSDAR